jgi:hypothetical protein
MNCPYCNLEMLETIDTYISSNEVCTTYSCSGKDNHDFFYRHTADLSYELFGLRMGNYVIKCFEGTCYFSIESYEIIIERVVACEAMETMNKYIRLKAFL